MFDFLVWATNDALYLDVEGSVRQKAVEWLDRFLISEKVDIADVSDNYAALEIAGPEAAQLLAGFGGDLSAPYACHEHGGMLLLRSHGTGGPTFQVWASRDELEAINCESYGFEAWNVLRQEAGHPVYGVDMDEENNPLEAGLNLAVSLDKGCYTGQEVMARLTFRQGPVRLRVGWKADALLPPGTQLLAGDKPMGSVTSSVWSPALKAPIAMGYVRREHKEPGSILKTTAGQPVEVVELPWVPAQ